MVNRSTPNTDAVSERAKRQLANRTDTGDTNTSDEQDLSEQVLAGEEPEVQVSSDIGTDRIVGADEAGLGGGLDQAEEARLGITDEELAEMARRTPK